MKRLMKISCLILSFILLTVLLCGCIGGDKPSESLPLDISQPSEQQSPAGTDTSAWLKEQIGNGKSPFSCTVGETEFAKVVSRMTVEVKDENDVLTANYTDPESGLVFTLTANFYGDTNSVDYFVNIENTRSKNSPKISSLYAIDAKIPVVRTNGLVLTTSRGCLDTGTSDEYDFEPVVTGMAVGGKYSFSPAGGRSCDEGWPYFDLFGGESGLMVAVGWTGQWQADFELCENNLVSVKAGQQYFDAYLKPGETVRTPSVTLQYYKGTEEDGRNGFRQLILKHATPDYGQDWVFPIGYDIRGNEEVIMAQIADNKNADIRTTAAWLDAGWYGYTENDWSTQVGNWNVNTAMYPSGSLKAISDAVHASGQDFMLWFELERAHASSDMAKTKRSLYYAYQEGDTLLLRLDSEEGYEWMYQTLHDRIAEWGVDIYRQDFNLRPLNYWLESDIKNRTGITENHYITNMYRLIDALRADYPDLIIDNCASGGRRLDIEMMKRTISMWNTDYPCLDHYEDEGSQYHMQNIFKWLPMTASGIRGNMYDAYSLYSGMNISTVLPTVVSNPEQMKEIVDSLLDMQKFYKGDFYTLLTPSFDYESWQSWELYRNDLGSGIAIVIVRKQATDESKKIVFKGLEAQETYRIGKYGDTETVYATESGEKLMQDGITMSLPAGGAVILTIDKVVK